MTHPLVAAARQYLGCPFRHQGRARDGMDCAGLVVLAARDCGHNPPDVPAYEPTPSNDRLREIVESYAGAPHVDGLRAGDIVLVAYRTEPHHLAIVGDYPYGGFSLIHCREDVRSGTDPGRVVEHRLDARWLRLIVRVYRLPVPTA